MLNPVDGNGRKTKISKCFKIMVIKIRRLKMNIITLILGIVIILFAIGAVIGSVIRTPENLRGFYGLMFAVIALGGIIGGIVLIVFSFLG